MNRFFDFGDQSGEGSEQSDERLRSPEPSLSTPGSPSRITYLSVDEMITFYDPLQQRIGLVMLSNRLVMPVGALYTVKNAMRLIEDLRAHIIALELGDDTLDDGLDDEEMRV